MPVPLIFALIVFGLGLLLWPIIVFSGYREFDQRKPLARNFHRNYWISITVAAFVAAGMAWVAL